MNNSRNLLIVLLLALSPSLLSAQEVDESVLVSENVADDFYAAGNQVIIEADIDGDAVLAGGTVIVTGAVSEDLIVAGGTVTVTGDIGDDLRAAGGTVTVTSNVGDHAVISGGTVEIEEGATINGWAWLAGGSVDMEGWITGDLRIAAGEIELSGRVDGDVELAGGEIEIEEGAVINGNLTWRSNEEPEIDQDVVITGEIIEGEPWPEYEQDSGFFDGLFGLLSLIFSAGLFYTVFRTRLDRCFASFQATPGRSLLVGLAVFAITPLIALLFFVTAVGWLLGMLVAAAYALALIAGGLTGITLTARWGLERFRQMPDPSLGSVWLAIAALAVVISLLYIIPPLGALVGTAILLLGLGTVADEVYREVRETAAG